jgi:anti-sigma factor RsiW
MRCARAQQLMTTAVDAELGDRRRRGLERHLAGCAPCAQEMTTTRALLDAVSGLGSERPVSVALEQATLRRVRLLAAEEDEAPRIRWWRLPLPAVALAGAAVLVLAVGLWRMTTDAPSVATPAHHEQASARVAAAPAPDAVRTVARHGAPPSEPPPELAAAPDLFMDMPILKNIERLDHFEAIRTTTLDDAPGPDGEASNG